VKRAAIGYTKTHDQYKDELAERNLEVVGRYQGAKVKILHKCADCSREWSVKPNDILCGTGCPSCASNGTSGPEIEITEFINSIGTFKTFQSDRSLLKGKEIDILIPDAKLAIEYDGLYWHSFNRPETKDERMYHVKKTMDAEVHGYQLLHIFENEWIDPIKRKIWMSMIRHRLGATTTTIGARETDVVELDSAAARKFLSTNHMSGFCGASRHMGLLHEGAIVHVSSFSKPRYSDDYEWELIRSASLTNTLIHGGLSRVLSKVDGSVLSYADRRYSTGIGYRRCGFDLLRTTSPGFYYFQDRRKLESRIKYQKKNLSELLGDHENYSPEKTAAENMFDCGFRRVWDCGHLVFGTI